MSTLKANTISNVAGSQSISTDRVAQGTAAAWVNFNGTGTVAIRASYNVTSITDNGTGDYTVNFTTALADANYAGVFSYSDQNNGGWQVMMQVYSQTTTTFRVGAIGTDTTYTAAADKSIVNVSVFR